jgi:dihydroorotase
LFFGAGIGNLEEIKKAKNIPGIKLYLNTTTGNLKMDDENSWKDIFNLGKKVALHAEGGTFQRATEIWEECGFPCELHLCHASLKSEIDRIQELRQNPQAKNKITVEICPHHLFLTHKEREEHGAICCMKPELATQKDLDALWEAVEDSTIDFFATDHAPHTLEEKQSDTPYFGIPGVETFLPLLFTEFNKRKLSLKKLAAMTSYNTVQTYRVSDKKGQLKEGFDADLVIIDPTKEYKIDPTKFFSKSKWSPFTDWEVTGQVEKTFVGGKLVYNQGQFLDLEFRGSEINFN